MSYILCINIELNYILIRINRFKSRLKEYFIFINRINFLDYEKIRKSILLKQLTDIFIH